MMSSFFYFFLLTIMIIYIRNVFKYEIIKKESDW